MQGEKKKQKKQPMALIEVQSWKRPESWVWEISGGEKNGQNFFFGGGWTVSCDVAAAARQLKANVDGKKANWREQEK